MKKRNYIFISVISFLLMSIIFLKPCVQNCSVWLTALCDFIVMIGSGIFCSTVVSWIIDLQNKKKQECERDEQRNFILSSVRNSYIRVFERELKEMALYYSKYLLEQKADWHKEDIPIVEIKEKILCLLEKFEQAEAEERETHTITVETINQNDVKRKMLAINNRFYYTQLHQNIEELSVYYNWFLISNILTEEKIELLKELAWDVEDVLRFEPEFGLDDGSIIEFKKIFFEKTSKFTVALDISENDKIHVHYNNVFRNNA